jgi:hypothetical protein
MNWTTGGPSPRIYRVEIDGMVFESRNHNHIFTKYRSWIESKGERVPINWEEVVWKALKSSYPKHIIRGKKNGSPGVSVATAASFLAFMAKRMRKRALVAPEEAKRRAAICSECPMKSAVLGCSICKDALQLFVKPPEKVVSPQACMACGCYLPVKVWVPRNQLGPTEDHPYDEGCWMRDAEIEQL